MNIVIVIDNQYAQYAGIMLTSMYKTTAYAKKITLYVIFHELSEDNKLQLQNIVEAYESKIVFIESNEKFDDFHEGAYVSKAAYLKINIPQYLPSSLERALYLDVDIIVNSDIMEFSQIDLEHYYIAAVLDDNEKYASDLGVSVEYYFNSGVLLLNLNRWRKDNISDRVYEFVTSPSNKRNTCDQDALNFVLWDKCLRLDRRYNYLPANHTFISDPIIIHYAAKDKPWHIIYSGEYKDIFLEYKEKCNWKNYNQPDMDILSNHKIVVYGASTAGSRAYESLQEHSLDIEYFVDGDNNKKGTLFMQKTVYDPEKLKELDGSYAIMVPSLSYYTEIKKLLERHSFYPLRVCNKIFLKQ